MPSFASPHRAADLVLARSVHCADAQSPHKGNVMATTTTVEGTDDHGFELKRRPKWLWIALSLALVVVVVVGARLLFFGKTESANEIAGATLVIATNEGMAAEKGLTGKIAKTGAHNTGNRGWC